MSYPLSRTVLFLLRYAIRGFTSLTFLSDSETWLLNRKELRNSLHLLGLRIVGPRIFPTYDRIPYLCGVSQKSSTYQSPRVLEVRLDPASSYIWKLDDVCTTEHNCTIPFPLSS